MFKLKKLLIVMTSFLTSKISYAVPDASKTRTSMTKEEIQVQGTGQLFYIDGDQEYLEVFDPSESLSLIKPPLAAAPTITPPIIY